MFKSAGAGPINYFKRTEFIHRKKKQVQFLPKLGKHWNSIQNPKAWLQETVNVQIGGGGSNRLIDWWLMIDWLMIDWLMIDWYILISRDDWLIDWLIDWLMIDWLMIDDWWLMIDWLIDWWLIDWLCRGCKSLSVVLRSCAPLLCSLSNVARMSNAQNAGNGNKSRSSLGQRYRWNTTMIAETSCGATIVPIIWKGRDKHRATKSCTNVWLAPRRKVEQRSKKNTLISIDGKNNICLYVVIAMLAKRRYFWSCGHRHHNLKSLIPTTLRSVGSPSSRPTRAAS